jgi:uncharacterized protein DUF3987
MSETFSLLHSYEQQQLGEYEARVASNDFILRWKALGAQRTDAPTEFHLATAITLVATAIDRNRRLELEHKTTYSSMYPLCLAPSGRRKTTAMAHGESVLADAAWSDVLLANEYSPEALVTHLGNRTPSHGTLFVDEAGRMFTTMQHRAYGEALKDILSRLWDAPPRYARQLSKGHSALTDVYLNVHLATTMSRLVETLHPEDIASGFLARFLPFVVTTPTERKPLRRRSNETRAKERELAEALIGIRDTLAKTPEAYEITDGALERLDEAEQHLEHWAAREFDRDLLQPWAHRLAEYGNRLAIIFAASEGASCIELPHVRRAIEVVDHAKDGALLIVDELQKGTHARNQEKLRQFVLSNPGISKRDAQRKAHWTTLQLDATASELEGLGLIRIERGDRGSFRYWPVADDGRASEASRGEPAYV